MKILMLAKLGLGGLAGYLAGKKLGFWGKKARPSPNPSPSPTPTPSAPSDQTPEHPSIDYSYTGQPQSTAVIGQWASQLAAVDPYDIHNAWVVRMFQWSVGLTQNDNVGFDSVTPAGTDGRYGYDTEVELGKYAAAPAVQASRPSWWGAPGTYTNPGEPAAPQGALDLAIT